MKDTILFYHSECPDGYASSFAFWKKFKDTITYYPIAHYEKEQIPEVSGKNVYMVDIAFERRIMEKIEKQAKSFVVLDHHISRYEELKDKSYYHFSDKYSGATLAWTYLFPNQEIPEIFLLIENRDLWKWDMPNAHELLALLDSYEFDFEKWSDFEQQLITNKSSLIQRGQDILRYCDQIANRIKSDLHTLKIRGIEVPAINTPFFKSEIVSEISLNQPFAAGYHYDGTRYQFSLRSAKDGLDVSKIAASFPGGGGHKHAAGFQVTSLDLLSEEKCRTKMIKFTQLKYLIQQITALMFTKT